MKAYLIAIWNELTVPQVMTVLKNQLERSDIGCITFLPASIRYRIP